MSHSWIGFTVCGLACAALIGSAPAPGGRARAAAPQQVQAPEATVAPIVTFQGRLTRPNGAPVTAPVQARFRFYTSTDPAIAPTAIWTSSLRTITPTQGLFTVYLGDAPDVPVLTDENLAATAAIGVQIVPDAEMRPRQPIQTIFGHTDGLNGAVVGGASGSGSGVVGRAANNGVGVEAYSRTGVGVQASTQTGKAVDASATGANAVAVNAASSAGNAVVGQSFTPGYAAIFGRNNFAGSYGVYGEANAANGIGVYGASANGAAGVSGVNSNGNGVAGRANAGGAGVYGEAAWAGGKGVYGVNRNINSSGVYGEANAIGGVGVYGKSNGNVGVYGESGAFSGVYGLSAGATSAGVWGEGTGSSGIGVRGVANGGGGVGVYGSSTANTGVYGVSTNARGVWGQSGANQGVYGRTLGTANSSIGVAGEGNGGSSWAGYFFGRSGSSGLVYAAGGAMQIDHPLDPANQYLNQSFVASPDMKSIYDGVVTTDDSGDAVVTLPAYVQALNGDFRYQLTVIGQFAQAIVAQEIANDRFAIKTDQPNVKVSWQVTGIRKDLYAQQNQLSAEQEKSAAERGRYLHPELYGQPESRGVFYEVRAAVAAPAGAATAIPGTITEVQP
jgi:hypothetical protein